MIQPIQQKENDYHQHLAPKRLVHLFIEQYMPFLFPVIAESEAQARDGAAGKWEKTFRKVIRDIGYGKNKAKIYAGVLAKESEVLRGKLLTDAEAIYAGDPAASSIEMIIACYPGFYSTGVYRVAHCIWTLGLRDFARMLTEYAHTRTGIDIHPGAVIGRGFCIDHGTGVVIGETTEIGDYVKIYQGVTLGALSVTKGLCDQKRHPTIGHYVTMYAGATILGGDTVIGDHSIVGGNVWLTSSIPPHSLVINKHQIHHTIKKDQYVTE